MKHEGIPDLTLFFKKLLKLKKKQSESMLPYHTLCKSEAKTLKKTCLIDLFPSKRYILNYNFKFDDDINFTSTTTIIVVLIIIMQSIYI